MTTLELLDDRADARHALVAMPAQSKS